MEKAYLQATFPKNELDPVHRAMLVDFMEYFLVDNDLYTKLNKTSQEERGDKTKLDAIFTAGKPKLKSFADEDSEFYDIYCEAYQRLYGLKRTNFMERALKLIGVSAENQILTQHIELMLDEHPGIMKRLKNKKEPSEADKKRLDDYMRQKEAKFKQFSALKSDSVDNCLQLLYLLFSGPDLRRPGHEIKRPGSMSSLDHLNPFIFKQQYRPKFNSTVAEGIIHDHAFDRSLLQMALLPTYGMSFFSPTKTSPHRASTRAQLLIWPDEKKNQGAQLKVFEIGYDLNREVASIFHVNIKKQCAKMQSTETAISKSVEPFNLEAWNFPAILPTQLLDKDTYSKEQFANCLFKELAPKKPAGPLIHFDEHGNVSKINISSKVTLLTNRFFESRLRSFISNKLRKDSKELEKYKEAGTPLSDSIDAIMFHDKISRTFAKLTFQLSHFKDELKMIVTRHLKRLISETGSMAADQKQSALLSLADFKKDWIDKKDLADSIKILQSVIEKFL
jgi:hypothetical protein